MTEASKDLLLQSIKTIRQLSDRLALHEQPCDIAIIGIACRFPGQVDGVDAYWDLLQAGRSGVVEVGADRWSKRQFVDPDYNAVGKLVTPYAGLLQQIYDFDAEFFGLSALEAENLDPQQRLLLEQSWLALEDAGFDIGALRGSDTGVFVGIGSQDYGMALLSDARHANAYVASGNSLSMAAGRLSYFYDFNGPSLSIDTACSSSLVAVHEACSRLRQGECRLALAAGVNAILTPHAGINFSRARMLTRERDCHVFDARAQGYVRGEGCGVLVLKRLADALADGDRIHALIKGSAINHDGHSSGLTVPNGSAQEAVIRAALRRAGLTPGDVSYVEAHGTGTRLGDPIEARALAAVFAEGHDVEHPLQLGGVKANLGHLEAAAGIAGLIKAALVVARGEAPPQPGFEQLNPKIEWDGEVFRIARRPSPLVRRGEGPLHAGVSSFGFSGTNAHVIVAAPPSPSAASSDMPDHEEQVLALSARSPRALRQHAEDMLAYLDARPATAVSALSHTSTRRRLALPERIAVTGRDPAELASRLRRALDSRTAASPRRRIVLFLSCHDDAGRLHALAGARPTDGGDLAQAHRGLLRQLAAFAVFPDQLVLQGIAPDPVRAWLAGAEAPAAGAYVSGTDELTLLEADGSRPAERAPDGLPTEAGAILLGQGTPPLRLPAAAEFHALGSPAELRRALAALFNAGVNIDWSPLYRQAPAVVVDFPRRCFERKTFKSPRLETLLRAHGGPGDEHLHPLVRSKLAQPDGRIAYGLDLASPWLEFIDQHRVRGRRLLPASLLIELMRRLAGDALGRPRPRLAALGFHHPVDIDLPGRDHVLQVQPGPQGAELSWWSRAADLPESAWTRHVSASCPPEAAAVALPPGMPALAGHGRALDLAALYAGHEAAGVELGAAFRCVTHLQRHDGGQLEGHIRLAGETSLDALQRMALVLDGCFQASAGGREAGDGIHLLAAIGEVVLPDELPDALQVRLTRQDSADGYRFDIAIADAQQRPLGHIADALFRPLADTPAANKTALSPDCFYAQRWLPAAWPAPASMAPRPALAALAEVLERCEPSTTWAERFGLAEYNRYRERVEQVCLALISQVLDELRLPARAEDAAQAIAGSGVVAAQQRLCAHLMAVLARQPVPVQGPADFGALAQHHPRFEAETAFMQRCGSALAEVLRGRREPLDVLFGGASMQGSEAVYIDSPISRVLNGQLGQLVAALGDRGPLRILEIGAGTGGTTRSVLDALRGMPVATYCYTDISPLFLERARTLFGEHRFLDYRLLDIEQPVAAQHFDPGSFDIVIAANVLHATRSIADTLRHVRDLLAPAGCLLLRECIKPQLSADISFGMTEGWWRFEDHVLRPDYAVLAPEQWAQQLTAQRFETVRTLLPHPLSAEALIVAQAARGSRGEHWLVVHDGPGRPWVEQLRRQGATCIDLSWQAASTMDSVPADTVFDHLLCLPAAPGHEDTDPVAAATPLYESMIAVCRHWLGHEATRQARLWCVTTQAERVNETDRLAGLAESVMTGVIKCAALEYPGRIGGVIDVQGEPGDIDRVLAHIRQPGALRYLAVRGGMPYAPKLQPLARQRQEPPPGESLPAAPADGTVLITGGLGGIGYALAQALAPRVDTLVLVSRQALSAARLDRLQALRGQRARVIARAADLADAGQVAALFDGLQSEGLSIDHLIHSAGIGGDRLLSASAPGDLREVVTAKLASTWHLHRHAARDLKSFLVLSTMVGLWGARQKAHYVLANHFADRVVQLRRAHGLAASLVQLGPVDSGMLDAAGKEAARRVGVRSFDVHQLAAVLTGPLPGAESALLDIDWPRFKPIYRFSWLDGLFEQVGTADDSPAGAAGRRQAAADFRSDYLALPPPRRAAFLEAQLFGVLREVLGLGGDRLSYLHTGFQDLGMDSLLTLSFAEKLSAHTGLAVSSVDVFDNADLARLRAWVATRLEPAGEGVLPQEVRTQEPAAAGVQAPSVDDMEQELRAMQALLEDR
ncbi:SDR family NAD(P)-dependent oxidoreductase [Aquabacterium sp. A7-Y]|uniref:type I polyketide synthase n=1 Tax=Aquabacterium sp. A7-Y TaxID=1349605 RepID=UPI00223D868A|nr:type I polyketide synthase [Aquabacterium sp. A7-Y]MCW7538528.1 SDR family NAD(P)-dependent oxidoreductase [Aquabacterium sp. A7-Y]